MMKIKKLIVAGTLSFFATFANSATVLVPSDGDVNFMVNKPFVDTWGYSLAIFDEAAVTSIDGTGVITDVSSIINVTLDGPFSGLNGPTYESLLGINGNFIVGLSTNEGITWLADSGSSFGINTALLEFNVPGVNETLVVDVNPVPVPAALWLFGSGLIGLVGVARKKKA